MKGIHWRSVGPCLDFVIKRQTPSACVTVQISHDECDGEKKVPIKSAISNFTVKGRISGFMKADSANRSNEFVSYRAPSGLKQRNIAVKTAI